MYTMPAALRPIDLGARLDAESEKLCTVAGTTAAVVTFAINPNPISPNRSYLYGPRSLPDCGPSIALALHMTCDGCTGFTYGM